MPSIFTKIIRGELPGEIVYETEHEAAILDLYPVTKGHTLVVPKLEVADIRDLPPERAASLMHAVQVTARGVTRAVGTPHFNLNLNNGAPAGQVVFHVHFHVIPRWEGQPKEKRKLSTEEMRDLGTRVRAALAELQNGS